MLLVFSLSYGFLLLKKKKLPPHVVWLFGFFLFRSEDFLNFSASFFTELFLFPPSLISKSFFLLSSSFFFFFFLSILLLLDLGELPLKGSLHFIRLLLWSCLFWLRSSVGGSLHTSFDFGCPFAPKSDHLNVSIKACGGVAHQLSI